MDGRDPYKAQASDNMTANGDWGESIDNPSIWSGIATSLSMDLYAEDFTLYSAPGGEPVPLMHGKWHHNSSAVYSGGAWTMPTNQTTRDLDGVKIATHPKWIHKMN